MDDFHRVIQRLGTDPASQSRSGTAPHVRITVSRDFSRATQSPVNVVSQGAISPSRAAQCGSPVKEEEVMYSDFLVKCFSFKGFPMISQTCCPPIKKKFFNSKTVFLVGAHWAWT